MNDWINKNKSDSELISQLNAMSDSEAHDAFYKNLTFGTGGMRGIVGPGTNRLNVFTLRKTNYGYAKYLLKKYNNPSVVIAYDSRHKSLEFARDTANILATMGVKVFLFDRITPTPVLSFAVRHLKTSGGIVITASHNPPQYNGYKVYDNDGCQLLPKAVNELSAEINDDLDIFGIEVSDYDTLVNNNKIVYVGDEVNNEYMTAVKTVSVYPKVKKLAKVVYTPLHGTGAYLGERILKELDYEYYTVPEQMIADPDFTTVKSPNPEDHNAFKLALKLAKEKEADIILATDPDADRLGVAVLDKGEYLFLTGNQVGAIMLYYLSTHNFFKGTLFDTIVSSDLGKEIAKSKGIETFSTLTGFKYIGEQIKISENTITLFFFGYEESSGFLIKDFVRDKDALQSLLLMSEISSYYKQHNKTLIDVLNEIYKKYGFYEEDIHTMMFEGEDGINKMEKVLDHFRNVDLESIGVVVVEDYLNSRRYGAPPLKINLPKENVLKFHLNDKSWFAMRPSGTEPKMKIYFSTNSPTKEEAVEKLSKLKKDVLKILEGVN